MTPHLVVFSQHFPTVNKKRIYICLGLLYFNPDKILLNFINNCLTILAHRYTLTVEFKLVFIFLFFLRYNISAPILILLRYLLRGRPVILRGKPVTRGKPVILRGKPVILRELAIILLPINLNIYYNTYYFFKHPFGLIIT